MLGRIVAPILAVGLFLSASATQAGAATIVMDVDFTFSGTDPAGSSPWLRATFTDVGTDTVQLTLSALGLTADEFVSAWYFSLDPAVTASTLSISLTGDPAEVGVQHTGQYKADGDGYFDIRFDYETSAAARFGAGDTFVYTISGAGLDASSFSFLSEPENPKNPKPGYYTAAHIQSITDSGYSGWVSGVPASVPDGGATALLLGLGMLGLGYARRRLQ